MSSSLEVIQGALTGLLGSTPEPCENIDLEEALSMSATMLSARQSYLVELERAVSAHGGFPLENEAIDSIVSEIEERDSRWMAVLQALRHQSQQQTLSRQRLRQLGSRAHSEGTEPIGKMHVLG